jgi:hypothetical protein
VATIGNYQEIVDEIFQSFYKSNLINFADRINVCVVGNCELNIPTNWNIKINQISDVNAGEFYTLEQIEKHAKTSITNDKILYLHTKGVTTPNNQCINDWRKYMLYFNVENFEKALIELKSYDTYGVDFVTEPAKHYSGNFWWANANHIKNLPSIEEISQTNSKAILTVRHNAEFWVCMANGKHKSGHNSNISVYERHLHRYEKVNYDS